MIKRFSGSLTHVRSLTFAVLFVAVLAGCRKEDPVTSDGSDIFVSATSSGTFTKVQLQALASFAGYSSFVPLIKNDVDFFKIIYKTTYKGSSIRASGLLAVPKGITTIPSLLSAQHGTMFRYSDAPSNFPAAFTGFELFGAAGFITAIPDFIGFGESKDTAQPYYDQQYSGTTVVDMLKACKFYIKSQNIAMSNRLFLVGYSEGGYVTMAAQKEVETHPEHQLTLTAAAEGAGGYDLSGMLSAIASVSTYSSPSFLALIVKSYNTTYGWNRPYSDFFQEPYASRLPALLNGSKTSDEINAQLTTSVQGLLNPTFYANLINPSGETVLKQALLKNGFADWYPKSPTKLYHGTSDSTVFYSTSVSTINKFKTLGATNAELVSIPGGTHGTSIEPMMLAVLPWFQSLDK